MLSSKGSKAGSPHFFPQSAKVSHGYSLGTQKRCPIIGWAGGLGGRGSRFPLSMATAHAAIPAKAIAVKSNEVMIGSSTAAERGGGIHLGAGSQIYIYANIDVSASCSCSSRFPM